MKQLTIPTYPTQHHAWHGLMLSHSTQSPCCLCLWPRSRRRFTTVEPNSMLAILRCHQKLRLTRSESTNASWTILSYLLASKNVKHAASLTMAKNKNTWTRTVYHDNAGASLPGLLLVIEANREVEDRRGKQTQERNLDIQVSRAKDRRYREIPRDETSPMTLCNTSNRLHLHAFHPLDSRKFMRKFMETLEMTYYRRLTSRVTSSQEQT